MSREKVKEALKQFALEKIAFMFDSGGFDPVIDLIEKPSEKLPAGTPFTINLQINVPPETVTSLRKEMKEG